MTRSERDSIGEVELPADALYGPSTQRALDNFPVSGYRMPIPLIHCLGLLKKVAADANAELGEIPRKKAELIQRAAEEVYRGEHDKAFPLDVFQTGSGTSTNMNANEVVANRANQIAGEKIDASFAIHPNDDVNKGQSSNDVMPSASNISIAIFVRNSLRPALQKLRNDLRTKKKEFEGIIKCGRTHLMDATPMTLGQEFSGYAAQLEAALERCDRIIDICRPLAIGGTVVGTGAFTHPDFGHEVCSRLSDELGIRFVEAANHFSAQASREEAVEIAGIITSIATGLEIIANNLRLLASGPRCGIGELKLPPLQPGSSIMPGKVNPVMCEMLAQVSGFVHGLCASVTEAAASGHLQLNTMMPLITHCLHESLRLLSNASKQFSEKCVQGIQADAEKCRKYVEHSMMLATNLCASIGYERTAEIAKRASVENKTLREILKEEKLLDEKAIDEALDPQAMLPCSS